MSLPYSPDAVDTEIITDTYWDQIVANYEAIFDGSAFNDESVVTKYGTVARYVRLHSGLTSQAITLQAGVDYMIVCLNSDSTARRGQIVQAGNPVFISGDEESFGLLTPDVTSYTCSTLNSGSWSGVEVKFLIIKLDNQADSWATSATIPYPDLDFADDEVLHATKLNKVIANVNARKTMMNVLGVEKIKIVNNTKTSMVVLGFGNGDEVTTPASTPADNIVATKDFDLDASLEGTVVMVSVSAEYLWTSNDYVPDRVDVRDSADNIVATKDFIIFNEANGHNMALPVSMIIPGLTEDTYTVELVYHLASTGSHAVSTAYPGITNITIMAFGA